MRSGESHSSAKEYLYTLKHEICEGLKFRNQQINDLNNFIVKLHKTLKTHKKWTKLKALIWFL